jgi:hypothetical protein
MMPRGPARKGVRGKEGAALALEPQVRSAVRRFVQVLARCGCAPQAIEGEVSKLCRQIPKSWAHRADLRDSVDPGHVMTLWFADPAYLDPRGRPRPVPLRGPALSIEDLAHRVDPKFDARYVVRYLMRGGGLKRIGARYVPNGRVVIYRGRESETPFLRGLFGLLRTLEHNSQRAGLAPGWLELSTRNPHFPVSAAEGFERRLRRRVNRFLVQIDADMHRREGARKQGERTVRMGVGVYQYEDVPPPVRRSGRGGGR